MICHNFSLFKMDISTKIELRQKIKCAENLVLYSSHEVMNLPPGVARCTGVK